jgi:photosystem II stability/assembly factor-like uncharacterized protein
MPFRQVLPTLLLLPAVAASAQASGPWEMEHSGTTANLRGIHAVGAGVAWASGANGTVLRTEDSGYMWQSCAMPPGAEKLDFRGIWAWDANTAIVMSSGPGDQSRLYKTTDGCSHWKLLYTNPDKDGFWDAVQFWDRENGEILGDPTETPDERFSHDAKAISELPANLEYTVLYTGNGGTTWTRQSYSKLMSSPLHISASRGGGAFAASNSSLAIVDHDAWFGTGGRNGSYVFIGDDFSPMPPGSGLCTCDPMPPTTIWFSHSVPVPLASGTDSSGVFSLVFRDPGYGVAVGGDYKKPDDSSGTAAWTADGGKTWTAATNPPHGYRSAVAFDSEHKAWITVGTNGTDVSYHDGKTWSPLDTGNWNALGLPWVVGPGGRIAKLVSLDATTRLH